MISHYRDEAVDPIPANGRLNYLTLCGEVINEINRCIHKIAEGIAPSCGICLKIKTARMRKES